MPNLMISDETKRQIRNVLGNAYSIR